MQIFSALSTAVLAAILLQGCVTVDQEWTGMARELYRNHYPQENTSAGTNALTTAQITAGLKEALAASSTEVTRFLGQKGGFAQDRLIRIRLPATLDKTRNTLELVGMAGMVNELEERMNEAAERAMPQARELFLSAIRQMTLEDAREILFGGQKDAATRYLRQTMGKILEERITPVVRNTLASTGAIQIYDRVTAQYAAFDFVTGAKTGLERYVTEKTLDGVFHYIAKEEEAIRANPAKRTSEILRLVFGNTAER